MPAVTTSWDDGSPEDLALAAMLDKHDFQGTFYLPTRNSEGRPTLRPGEISELSGRFDIGGHGTNHLPLSGLSDETCKREILDNKAYLEGIIQREMRGFCLIRGAGGFREYKMARSCGYAFVRTILRSRRVVNRDRGTLHVSEQFYPHSLLTEAKGALRCLARFELPLPLVLRRTEPDLLKIIERAALAALDKNRPLHIWGHSWEVKEAGLWSSLEECLRVLAAYFPKDCRVNNSELFADAQEQTSGVEAADRVSL